MLGKNFMKIGPTVWKIQAFKYFKITVMGATILIWQSRDQFLTRKDMALSAISICSALADKEFVLSLHHKLHVSTCINKPNDIHKHNQSIFHSINQSFLHKQQ